MDDRVAIITAASRGMGAACARALAERGYRLVLLSRSPDVEALAAELSGTAVRGSVTEPTDLDALVRRAVERHDRIDVVVNNTGHPVKGPLLEISDEDWHAGLDLVFLNVVRLARLVTPIMEEKGGGAFVNISTFGAVEPSTQFPISSALRAALSNFTKQFADEFASRGIRMNSVLPGFIDSYEIDETTRDAIPMQRTGRVTEVAQVVAFLASPEAGYVTGQNVRVDGGLTRGAS